MPRGYLLIVIGQSWLDAVYSGSTRKPLGELASVKQMTAGSRVFSPFNDATNWNTYYNGVVNGNCPQFKIAAEWEGRSNNGQTSDVLYIVSVVRGGSGFDLNYSVENFSMWRSDRNMNDGDGGSNGLFSIPADQGGGVYPIGDTYSAYETLRQVCEAAPGLITADGNTPYLLGVLWGQGQAEATVTGLTQTSYYAYETSLKSLIESELGIAEAPWYTMPIVGDAVGRVAADEVNAAKAQIVNEFTLAASLDLSQAPEYDGEDLDTYGGLFGSDGNHLSDLGCWRAAEMLFKLTVDNENFGVAL